MIIIYITLVSINFKLIRFLFTLKLAYKNNIIATKKLT
jgi:hypothetical protein